MSTPCAFERSTTRSSDEETDDEMPHLEFAGATEQPPTPTLTSPTNVVLHSIFSNDNDEDDEVPQPEVTETYSSSTSPLAATAPNRIQNIVGEDISMGFSPNNNNNNNNQTAKHEIPTRRILRAVRPTNDRSISTTNYGLPVASPNSNSNTAVPVRVDWNLFAAPSDESPTTFTFDFSGRGNGTTTSTSNTTLATSFQFGTDNNNDNSSSNNNGTNYTENNNTADAGDDDDDDEVLSYHSNEEGDGDDDDDEILSYHSSEEEYDDSDDDDDSDDGPPGMPPGMLNFFHQMTQLVNGSDEDDDDADDAPCTCSHCLMEQFGCAAEEDDDNNNNDDEEVILVDPNATPCAVCMEPETSRRPFALLPCCGSDGKESTSSTRFCKKCLVMYLAQNGGTVPAPAPNQSSHCLAGECPRCKYLLVLNETISTDKSIPYYKRVEPTTACSKSYHWYVGRKDSGQYRPYLLTIGWCSSNFIAEELLLNDPGSFKRIGDLCQWGLLEKHKISAPKTSKLVQKVQSLLHQKFPDWIKDPSGSDGTNSLPNHEGWVYSVQPEVQRELRNLLQKHMEIDVDDDLQLRLSTSEGLPSETNTRKQCFLVACNCAASAWMALCMLRVVRAIRIANRGLTLLLMSSKRLLPNVAEWPTDPKKHAMCWHALTALNGVLLFMAFRILFKLAVILGYVAQAFVICWLLGSCMVTPKCTWKRWYRNGSLLGATIYGLYRMWCLYTCWDAVAEDTMDGVEVAIDGAAEESLVTDEL